MASSESSRIAELNQVPREHLLVPAKDPTRVDDPATSRRAPGTIGPSKRHDDERILPPQVHKHSKLKEMGSNVWLELGLGR